MEKHEPRGISFAEIVDIIKNRKKVLFLSLALALGPILLYNYFATPIYEASAIVVFEDQSKETVMGFNFASSLYRGNFVANRIQEMKTKTFARQVYAELPETTRSLFRVPKPLPPNFSRERYIVNTIRNNLSVQPVKTTDLVTISYASENPELAKIVTNTVATVLQETNLRVRRQESASVREFIDEQIRVVRDRLQQAEEVLRDFKANENIASLDDESKEILQRITQAEILYNQVQTDKGAKQKRLAAIREKLNEQKQDLASSVTENVSPLTVKLKEKLVELEVRYAGLQAQNYPDDHPKMAELKAEIDQAKQNLMRTITRILEQEKLKGVLDPLAQLQKSLEESLLLEAELQSLNAQETQLQKTLASYSDYLKTLPDKELTLVRLMRDKEVNNKIYLRLLEEREQARIREAAEIGNIRVMEPAETPRLPTRPRKVVNMLIGLFAGTVFGLFVILVREFSREIPRTQEQVEQILNLPVLAAVPKIKRGLAFMMNGRYRQHAMINNGAALPVTRDAYSYLWSSLQFSRQPKAHSVMITSAGPGEGKSTLAANLSITAARHGKKTILIDGDLRKPVLHNMFEVALSPGLTNVVAGGMEAIRENANPTIAIAENENIGSTTLATFDSDRYSPVREAIISSIRAALHITTVENLWILPVGDSILAPDILWTSPIIEDLVKILKQSAEMIIIDAPPVIGIPDAGAMVHYFDGIILCVEAEQTEKKMLLRAQKILEHAGSKFWGVVLNKVDPISVYGSNKYYKYYVKHYNKDKHRGTSQA